MAGTLANLNLRVKCSDGFDSSQRHQWRPRPVRPRARWSAPSCRSCTGALVTACLVRVEVDSDGREVRPKEADHEAVEKRKVAKPVLCIVVREDRRGACVPAATELQSHSRIRAEVLHVSRFETVIADHPKRHRLPTAADGGSPREARTATGRLEQGLA